LEAQKDFRRAKKHQGSPHSGVDLSQDQKGYSPLEFGHGVPKFEFFVPTGGNSKTGSGFYIRPL